MKTMRCEQCASTDLLRVGEGEYVCNHCAARMMPSPQERTPPKNGASASRPVATAPHSLPRRVLSIVLIFGAVCLVAGLRFQRAERIAHERQRRAIQRSVSTSLATVFGNRPSPMSPGVGSSGARATPAQEYSGAAVVAPQVVSATFTDTVELPDSIGNIYFVGIYKNTGEAAIDHPGQQATLSGCRQAQAGSGARLRGGDAASAGSRDPDQDSRSASARSRLGELQH